MLYFNLPSNRSIRIPEWFLMTLSHCLCTNIFYWGLIFCMTKDFYQFCLSVWTTWFLIIEIQNLFWTSMSQQMEYITVCDNMWHAVKLSCFEMLPFKFSVILSLILSDLLWYHFPVSFCQPVKYSIWIVVFRFPNVCCELSLVNIPVLFWVTYNKSHPE